jgi:hypothetical protein
MAYRLSALGLADLRGIDREKAGALQRSDLEVRGSQAAQIFAGPSLLGVYRAIGVEAGLQFPLYRDTGPLYPRERYRFALNFAYFF